jgi:hypothetical protein
VAQANAVNAQWLGNNDVVHARLAKVAALSQIAHATKAARFFVHRAANF